MRKVSYIILVLLLSACISGCNSNRQDKGYEYEYSYEYLLQNIKISFVEGRDVEVKLVRNKEESDVLETSTIYVDDKEYATEIYELNEARDVISIFHDGESEYQVDISIVYEEKGNIVRRDVTVCDEKFSVVYDYEENGRYKKISILDEEDRIISYYTFINDSEYAKEKVEEYNADGELVSYYINTYAAIGEVVKTEKYSLNDELESTTIFSYFKFSKSMINFE